MNTTRKLSAAVIAAVLALSMAGCGTVEEDNIKGAAEAVSETVTSAEQNSEAPAAEDSSSAEEKDTEKEKAENSGSTDGANGLKISVAEGFKDVVRYTPSAEEMSGLVQLAREQHNAVLNRDPDGYFNTLNIRGLFENGDYDLFTKKVADHHGDEASVSYFLFTDLFQSILWDWACVDDPGIMSGDYWADNEDEWEEEEDGGTSEETARAEKEKEKSPYQKALDNISADFFRNADPNDKKLAGTQFSGNYFYPVYYPDRMEGIKPISESAVCTGVELYSSVDFDGCKCIEFSAEFADGGETFRVSHALGWIKDGNSGVRTDFTGYSLYGRDMSVEITKEQEDALFRLGVEQYNAMVSRDAESYLRTVDLDKSLEGLTKEDILERWESQEMMLPEGFDVVLDCVSYKDPSLKEPFHNDELLAEKYESNQQNAARVWYEAAADLYLSGGVTPELVAEIDKDESIRGELVSNYFESYDYLRSKYGELSPVAIENVFTDEDTSAEKCDDGSVYVSMWLRYKDGGETRFMGRLDGYIYADGSMSVYLSDIIPDGDEETEVIDDANRGS